MINSLSGHGIKAFGNAAIILALSLAHSGAAGIADQQEQNSPAVTETVVGPNGVTRITTTIPIGKLGAKIRKVEEVTNGETKLIDETEFDDKGNRVRETLGDGTESIYTYGEDRKLLLQTKTKNGKPECVITYEKNSQTVTSPDGRTYKNNYDENGREISLFINGKLQSTRSYAPDGKWEQIDVYSEKDGSRERSFYKEFDDKKQELLEIDSEYQSEYPPVTKQYLYDANGDLEKELNSQDGNIGYTKDSEGNEVAEYISPENEDASQKVDPECVVEVFAKALKVESQNIVLVRKLMDLETRRVMASGSLDAEKVHRWLENSYVLNIFEVKEGIKEHSKMIACFTRRREGEQAIFNPPENSQWLLVIENRSVNDSDQIPFVEPPDLVNGLSSATKKNRLDVDIPMLMFNFRTIQEHMEELDTTTLKLETRWGTDIWARLKAGLVGD